MIGKFFGSLIFAILFIWTNIVVMERAASFGVTWNCKSNPKEDVSVTFKNGEVITGTLSCNWDKSKVLLVPGRGEIVFKEFTMITYNVPFKSEPFIQNSWRVVLPPSLVFTLFSIGYLYLFFYVRNTKSLNKNVE